MFQPTFLEESSDEVDGKIVTTITKYWNCPIKFIPNSMATFMSEYSYYKEFSGAVMPSYDDLNPKFKEALRYYNEELAKATRSKHG